METMTEPTMPPTINHLPNCNGSLIMEEESMTPIQKFYDNCNVFITGGTGFLGKSEYTMFNCQFRDLNLKTTSNRLLFQCSSINC